MCINCGNIACEGCNMGNKMKRTTKLSCDDLSCSCCNTMRHEVSGLEQQNAKLIEALEKTVKMLKGVRFKRVIDGITEVIEAMPNKHYRR